MANEIFKTLNTRIALRTGDYAYWTTGAGKDIELRKGEVCICTIAAADNQATNAPTVLFKVADANGKKFADLKWTSALAADVYEWAKAADVVFENEHILFKNAAGGTIKDLDLSTFATNGELEEVGRELAQLEGLVHGPQEALNTTAQTAFGGINEIYGRLGDVDTLATGNTDTVVAGVNEVVGNIGLLSDLNTTNKGNLVAAINEALQAVEAGGTGSVVTVTKATIPTTGSEATYVVNQGGKPVDVKIEIPKYATSADYGVLGVTAGNDTITIGGTAQNPTVAVAANKFDAYGAAAQALVDAKAYADAKPHENTAHTHSVGAGLKKTGDGGINGDVKYELNVAFELVDKTIKLYDKNDSTKTAIATLDATEFIADGMLKSVTPDQTNNKLVFEWNTDAGVTKTEIPLSSIADIYTGSTGNEVNVAVSNQNVISASLDGEVATKIGHGEEAYGWGNHANGGYAKEADLGDLAGKDKIVANDIEGTIGKDKITNFANEVAAVKVNAAVDADKLGGAVATDYLKKGDAEGYGDILTKTAAQNLYQAKGEYATSEQGGKADTALQEVEVGTGLTVTEKANNKQKIEIDETVVFILDCNW